MGSPSAYLNTPENLRPWKNFGLSRMFIPGLSCVEPDNSNYKVSSDQATQPHQPISTLATRIDWPSPWNKFHKIIKGNPKIIITYRELGMDLGGKPDPARGNLLRNLIGLLKWQKGTTAFWPFTIFRDDKLEEHPDKFWLGVGEMDVKHIGLFGRESLSLLCPNAPKDAAEYIHNKVAVHVLPPIHELVSLLPHERFQHVTNLHGLRF